MKELFKNYLYEKNILVNDYKTPVEHPFETAFSLARLFGIRVVEGHDLLHHSLIAYAEEQEVRSVPAPFYRGFPESVRSLSKEALLFDQLVHYVVTYGFGDFSEPGYSLFEKDFERCAFAEDVTLRDFRVLDEKTAEGYLLEIVTGCLGSTRPLSNTEYELVLEYFRTYGDVDLPVASKNTQIRLLADTRNLDYAKGLMLSDVIKLVEHIQYRVYGCRNVKALHFSSSDRKFVTAVINDIARRGAVDLRTCYEKKAVWCGLLHHIHYKPCCEEARVFTQAMRSKGNESVYSDFEKEMTAGNVRGAVQVLKSGKGSGALMRNLYYVLSRCQNNEDVDYVLSQVDKSNPIILLQMMVAGTNSGERTFRFVKHNLLQVHNETEEEVLARKSRLSPAVAERVTNVLREAVAAAYHGRLGKVYIHPSMAKIAVPLQEATGMSGAGVLPKGSRLPMPEGKKIRAFTYWELVHDIDLSVVGLSDPARVDCELMTVEFSWRNMAYKQNAAITFSGDQTSGYKGGSEYFDIDLEKFRSIYPSLRYLVFSNAMYSSSTFDQCYCTAGYMLRDLLDSGEVYEPKTVKSSFRVNGATTQAHLFALDLVKNEFVWLNVSRHSESHITALAGVNFLAPYFELADKLNLQMLFTMLATEVVDDPAKADVVVTDEVLELAEGVEQYRSNDVERIMALLS